MITNENRCERPSPATLFRDLLTPPQFSKVQITIHQLYCTLPHTHILWVGGVGGGQSLVVEVGNSCLMSCRGHQEASQVPQPDRMTGGNTSLSVTVTNCHLSLPSIVQDKETFESKAFPSAKDTQSERHFFELKCSLHDTSCRQSVVTYQNPP